MGKGRPYTFSQDVADAIVQRVSEGEPLAQVCRDEDMPGLTTVYDWLRREASFSEAYALARVSGHDRIAADCLQIADNAGEKADPQRDKLRVETRLKLLAKWDPKRYGDSVQLRHADNEGERILTPIEAAARLAGIIEAAKGRLANMPALPGANPEQGTEPDE